jgi:hypothetical protein
MIRFSGGVTLKFDRRGTIVTFLAALGLTILALVGSFASGVPEIVTPFPALIAIPALILSAWHMEYSAVLIPGLLFLAWNPQLLRAEGKIPKRSYAVFAVLVALSAFYFLESWKWGVEYQGAWLTTLFCWINVAWVVVLSLISLRSLIVAPSFRTNVFFHWILFAWLAWFAFPWLGELP